MSNTTQFDYIIAGGGTAGSVLARRLSDKFPSSSILLIEAGIPPVPHPLIGPPLACFAAHHSDIDWAYSSVPQKFIGGKPAYQGGGKVLSGGTAVNYGLWSRGPACEYDQWAELAGDESWGWKGLLPYFIKTESYIPTTGPIDPTLHGTSGPITAISVTASHPNRTYPLKTPIAQLLQSAGYDPNPDGNSGSVRGYSELIENWKNGVRQPASVAYKIEECENVTVLTSTLVYRVLFDGDEGANGKRKKAVGVESDKGVFGARKEVILCAGAYRSPHILLLSGIGPASTLSKHGINIILDNPAVGQNLHDHMAVPLYLKLKDEHKGSALDITSSSSKLSGPQFKYGLPKNYLAFSHDPAVPIIAKSEGVDETTLKHLSHPERCHTEVFFAYVSAGPGAHKFKADGKTVTAMILSMTPTSRGYISIASSDPSLDPVIDPNYYATETDRVAIRNGVKKVLGAAFSTPIGQSLFEEELVYHKAGGNGDSKSGSGGGGDTDEAIDARVAEYGHTFYHPAGTCSMGTVVDGKCKVMGVDGLRVVDASVMPLPIGAHYQATIYALAEKVADAF